MNYPDDWPQFSGDFDLHADAARDSYVYDRFLAGTFEDVVGVEIADFDNALLMGGEIAK